MRDASEPRNLFGGTDIAPGLALVEQPDGGWALVNWAEAGTGERCIGDDAPPPPSVPVTAFQAGFLLAMAQSGNAISVPCIPPSRTEQPEAVAAALCQSGAAQSRALGLILAECRRVSADLAALLRRGEGF